jgi:nucleotide-binding universal stress UspA family protein
MTASAPQLKVLVATDGSGPAKAAAAWTATLPFPATAEMLVVAAACPPPPMVDVPVSADLIEATAADARASATETAGILSARYGRTTTRVVDGDPRRAIPATAREWGADLVVVGARGLGGFARLLLGSVSAAVVHEAPCPVLVVRGQPRGLGTVVAAVDGSAHAFDAARFLARLPLDGKTRVKLLGVIEREYVPRLAPASAGALVQAAIAARQAERRAELERALATIAPEFESVADTIERVIATGLPADEILAAAEGADLITIGARGHGALERLLLGSVSERVLHHAPCSVLISRGRSG